MANRIKGITIEIGGDTTKLNDALKDVDKQLSSTQRNLRDVNRLLKFDPSNTDLLKQKQKGLSESIKLTKDRLDQLKDAQSKVSEGTSEWDALQREIASTEQNLKSLEKEYKDFGSVAQQKLKVVGGKMQALGDNIKSVGENLTKYVTGPILAIGAGSIASWKEIDAALDTVTKKTGATGDALAEMQKQVRDIATDIPVSFEDAGTAIGEVNTRFGLTGEALQNLSEDFLKFADINETDVNSSIDTIQSAMAAFNTDTEKASQVLDLFTAAGQQTGVPIEALTESVKKNAVALQEMGFGLEDSVMFLAELDKNGVDSQTTLAGLKAALKNATKEGIPMNEALAQIQESLKGAKSDTEAAQLATELFGSKAGTAISEYVRNGQLDFESLGGSLEQYSGIVTQTYEETQDPMDQLETTLNDIKDIGYEIAEAGAPMLAEALGVVRDVVQDLKDKWDALTPDQQEMIIQFALVAAAVGPLLMVLGSVVSTIGSLIIFGPVLVGAIGAVGSALLPIIGIIGLVVAAGVWLYQNWEDICAFAKQLKDDVTQQWGEIKEKCSKFAEDTKQTVMNNWETMKNGVTGAASTIQRTASDTFETVKRTISEKMESAKSVVSGAIEKIKGMFNFSWHLPDLKLPHIHVGSYIDVPVLGTIPDPSTLSVQWYKKAYKQPIMFNKPTVLQTPNGLKGFGDGHGGEVVLSEERLKAMAGTTNNTVNIYGADQKSAKAIASEVQTIFVQWQREDDRVYA